MPNYTCILSAPNGNHSMCSPACMWRLGSRQHRLWTISVASWPMLARPGAQETFVRQTAFGTLRWSSLLQNAPQVMEWDTTVTTWTSTALMNRPAVSPCVTCGSVGRPTTVISYPQTLKPFTICKCIVYTLHSVLYHHDHIVVSCCFNIKDKDLLWDKEDFLSTMLTYIWVFRWRHANVKWRDCSEASLRHSDDLS